MESTGVYWIPAFEILEAHGFEVILVNARYAKNVPGRKTDVSDAGWLRQLHSYGLLRGSFRPEAEIATLRAYMRQRERLPADALGDDVRAAWPCVHTIASVTRQREHVREGRITNVETETVYLITSLSQPDPQRIL